MIAFTLPAIFAEDRVEAVCTCACCVQASGLAALSASSDCFDGLEWFVVWCKPASGEQAAEMRRERVRTSSRWRFVVSPWLATTGCGWLAGRDDDTDFFASGCPRRCCCSLRLFFPRHQRVLVGLVSV